MSPSPNPGAAEHPCAHNQQKTRPRGTCPSPGPFCYGETEAQEPRGEALGKGTCGKKSSAPQDQLPTASASSLSLSCRAGSCSCKQWQLPGPAAPRPTPPPPSQPSHSQQEGREQQHGAVERPAPARHPPALLLVHAAPAEPAAAAAAEAASHQRHQDDEEEPDGRAHQEAQLVEQQLGEEGGEAARSRHPLASPAPHPAPVGRDGSRLLTSFTYSSDPFSLWGCAKSAISSGRQGAERAVSCLWGWGLSEWVPAPWRGVPSTEHHPQPCADCTSLPLPAVPPSHNFSQPFWHCPSPNSLFLGGVPSGCFGKDALINPSLPWLGARLQPSPAQEEQAGIGAGDWEICTDGDKVPPGCCFPSSRGSPCP